MNLFGLTISRTKAAVASTSMTTVSNRGGWYRIFEPFAGAWQRNIDESPESVLSFAAVYACVTLIASSVSKLRIRLVEQTAEGIWNEATSPAFSPVLRKPNGYQNRIQFYEHWMLSKLIHGNTYVLKDRDNRGVVVAQYVLDPSRVTVMVTADGSVWYALATDNLSGIESERTMVPANEIIHDRMSPMFHPLCGVSPISACGLAAMQGLRVQSHSENFWENGGQPGGILTSPLKISTEDQKSYQEQWAQNYGGDNAGRLAVLGGGLTYQPLGVMTAVDAQLIEQLKLSAEICCTAFKVPAYMVGVGPVPAHNNIEALIQQFYAQCLQTHIESIELLQDEGLALEKVEGKTFGTEFDLDDLFRMDSLTLTNVLKEQTGAGITKIDEARLRLNLPRVAGGDTPYLQQQNYSLAALAKRDAGPDPFGTNTPKPAPESPKPAVTDGDANEKSPVLRFESAVPASVLKHMAYGMAMSEFRQKRAA